ncbi:XdhC family protein [Paenibacillus macerans]|uniref:XdhC family protein n=1 Tax=Paenibacillus macerans TaxID=44252 RepID=UPI003D31E7D8
MSMYDIAAYIKDHELPAVLATLIRVEGHSYRKPGASMLFTEGGSIGSLSPGCLEQDLRLRTEGIWMSGRPMTVEYDMLSPDDMSWGEAVGCGGNIRIVMEPVEGELRKLLTEAHDHMLRGKSLLLRRFQDGAGYAYRLEEFVLQEQQPAHKLRSQLLQMFADASFATLLTPKPRLVLFGAGRDGRSVAELASRAGFRVAVADWREAGLESGFPAEESVVCPPDEAPRWLNITGADYVLICSHSFRRDRQFLECVLDRGPRYLGVIGSRARIALLLEGLEPPESLHAPAGLALGGEGPEEIAVSIVAELIRAKRAKARYAISKEGGNENEDCRDLFGGGFRQPDGRLQGFA